MADAVLPDLAIVAPVIERGEDRPIENSGSGRKAHSVLGDVGDVLVFVPLKLDSFKVAPFVVTFKIAFSLERPLMGLRSQSGSRARSVWGLEPFDRGLLQHN